MEKVTISIKELQRLCPTCYTKISKSFGVGVKRVRITKSDYTWLRKAEADRPPKEWWDKCMTDVVKKGGGETADNICMKVWDEREPEDEGDEEALIPDTEDTVEEVQARMDADETVAKMRKEISQIMEWRKSGKALTPEQTYVVNKVVDDMIGFKVANKAGIQLVSRANVNFIKGEAQMRSQDAVESGASEDGEFPLKAKKKVPKAKVYKAAKIASDPMATITSKQKVIPSSVQESGDVPRKTPDIAAIALDEAPGQKEGAVRSTYESEALGHNPNLPMPKMMADDLLQNAKWGVEIGAYTSVKEGVDRQLGRKAYAEFVDTPAKLKSVQLYLAALTKEVVAE